MAMLERLRNRPRLLSALLGGLLGATLGLLRPLAPTVSMRAPAEVDWRLPPMSVISRFDDKQFAVVQQKRLFGTVAPAGRAGRGGAQGRHWRLTGIILEPAPVALVLAEGDSQVSRVAIGEALPDGSILTAVDAGGVEFQREGCQWQQRLYAAEDAVDTSRCPADAVTDDEPQGRP